MHVFANPVTYYVWILIDDKNFTAGPNSFYCICHKHKEKPVPTDPPPEEKTDESDKKHSRFGCVIF